jgi:D-arabinose 1-dehydrogenase-like Zn-dependent alcohol dehydrogenase
MLLRKLCTPLQDCIVPDPEPGPDQVLVRIAACGVCRTDLHVVDGDLTEPKLPIIPGHEIVGRIEALGSGVTTYRPGQRVLWLTAVPAVNAWTTTSVVQIKSVGMSRIWKACGFIPLPLDPAT